MMSYLLYKSGSRHKFANSNVLRFELVSLCIAGAGYNNVNVVALSNKYHGLWWTYQGNLYFNELLKALNYLCINILEFVKCLISLYM